MKVVSRLTREYRVKSSTTTPSPRRISFKIDGHSASDCSNSKEPISPSTILCLLLRPLPGRLEASSCSFFNLLHVSVFSALTRLELPPPITVSSYVLCYLTQGCYIPAPCRATDIFSALEVSQQYDILIGKPFRVSPLPNEPPIPLSATLFKGFKKDDITLPSILMRIFRAPVQNICGLESSRGTTSDDVSPYLYTKETLSSTSRSPSPATSLAIPAGRNSNKVYP